MDINFAELFNRLKILLLRQEMYIGEVTKGALTPDQFDELLEMALTGLVVAQYYEYPKDLDIALDSKHIPFDIDPLEREKILNDVAGVMKTFNSR